MLPRLATLALFLKGTEALRISNQHQHKHRLSVKQGLPEHCTAGLERLHDPAQQAMWDNADPSAPFEDPSMPADNYALYWSSHPGQGEMPERYDRVVTGWARPPEISATPPSLWGEQGVSPAGSRQGTLGDCWFLSTCAAIAENGDRIKKIFTNTEYPANGMFQLKFHVNGAEQLVVIDDRLAVTEGMDPGYTNFGVKKATNANVSAHGAWWLPILEKGFAKLVTNYHNMNGGASVEAFHLLTGMPTIDFKTADMSVDDIFAKIKEADGYNYIMNGGAQNPNNYHITTGHAYSILGAKELSNGARLIQVRNPWGNELYDGPWSDDSADWTPELEAEAGLTKANDGKYFLPVEVFKEVYSNFAICAYWDWQVDQKHQEGTETEYTWEFTSDVDQEVYFQLEFTPKRLLARGCAQDPYNYNVFMKENGTQYAQEAVYGGYGYFAYRLYAKAGTTQSMTVHNFGPEVNSDLTVTSFCEKSKCAFV